jgi:two-component system CheB/CheR fusion protein
MPKRKPQPRRPSKAGSATVRARARKAPPVPATAVAPTPDGFGAVGFAESNVDLISANARLQSSREELEVTKEELWTANVELETVNRELRQKVHELGTANAHLHNLFSATQVATIFLDRDQKLAKFTPAARALFHFIDTDLGRPLGDLAPRFAGTDLLADVADVQRTLVPVEREVRAGESWLVLRVLPYRTLTDAIAGTIINFADVTRLKRAETALREGEQLLRDVIDGSPSPIFLKDLQGRFLTINKRLEGMLGMSRDLTSLVDDLLDITRVTRGKIRLEKEPVNLDELVGRTVEDHRDLFARAGVKLALRPSGVRLMVHADRTRLIQVVGNLLQNAVKFTPKGGTTTVLVESRGDGQAAVRICDTGAGIGADILPHLFEPFTQADRTLDRSKGGLGLGLALVKGLVEMHDGRVAAQSEGPGQGAEFEVVLPTIPPSEIAEPRPPIAQAPVQPRRVLIIEDNRDAADSLREVLDLLNHSAMVAYSGDEGLEKIRSHRPDVILCDIGLPGMDGHDVARAIRADTTLSATTLVALTGYAAPEDLAKSHEAGFDFHLAKPPSIEAIEQVLAQAMRRTGNPQLQE